MSYKSIRVREEVYEKLLEMQGLFQYRDKKMYSVSDVIESLVAEAPAIEIPFDSQFTVEDVKVRRRGRPKAIKEASGK